MCSIQSYIKLVALYFQVMLTYLDDVVENFVLSRSAAYMCVNKLNSLSEVNSVRSSFDWG